MTTLLATAQLAALLLGQDATPAAQATPSSNKDSVTRPAEPPVIIDFAAGPVSVGDVTLPASPQFFGLTLATTKQRGPDGRDWGGRGYISVALPRGLGRIDWHLGKNTLRDTPFRNYIASPAVLASNRPLPDATVYLSSTRDHEAWIGGLGWSRRFWLGGRWSLTTALALRNNSLSREIADQIEGPEQASYERIQGERIPAHIQETVEKEYSGPRVGLTLSAPVAGSATFEVEVGTFVAHVTERCYACATYGLDSSEQRRTEILPDLVLRLRIPIGEHVDLNGGYRWESWGKDSFDKLSWSGRFFAFTFLIGRRVR